MGEKLLPIMETSIEWWIRRVAPLSTLRRFLFRYDVVNRVGRMPRAMGFEIGGAWYAPYICPGRRVDKARSAYPPITEISKMHNIFSHPVRSLTLKSL